QLPEQIGVKLDTQVWVMSTLKQQLIPAIFKGFLNLDFVGFYVGNIAFFVPRSPKEVAKLAVGDTDIGRVDVTVNLPGHFAVRILYLSKFIGDIRQISRCRMFI